MSVNLHLGVVSSFLDSLMESGVRDFCVSPGSRSTPLTAVLTRQTKAKVWSLLDERSAGFFALGLAKSSGRAVALVCTSGTATANYLPAVMEAFHSEVPLVVITADRPPELREVGSNQTVDQLKLYGGFVKWFYEMPVPEAGWDSDAAHRHAQRIGVYAVSRALSAPFGPVHVNYPFREPLMPPRESSTGIVPAPRSLPAAPLRLHPEALLEISGLLRDCARPLIVCGPQDDPNLVFPLMSLANRVNAVVLADPLSQVRQHPNTDVSRVVETYDLLLRHPRWRTRVRPDLVIRLGRTPTSKALLQSLSEWKDAVQIVVHEGESWADPTFTGTHFVRSNPVAFCEDLSRLPIVREADNRWNSAWAEGQSVVMEGILNNVGAESSSMTFEGRLFLELSYLLPEDTPLMVGNSMPIRHADTFLPTQNKRIPLYGNRGVSGIDGVLSSAFGVAAGSAKSAVLVIGDVSMLHDLAALLAAKRLGLSLLVILVHNDGGGIFTFLPQASFPDVVSAFTTPHGVEFQSAVEMFGGEWLSPGSWAEFREAVLDSIDAEGLRVIQLRLDKEESQQAHDAFVAGCMRRLDEENAWE